ncbi:hypothetical protein [Carboxylicivirga marina]|uniref:Cytochrome c domain-containing protein n=1 Tax=Carboxylicivirga marina TaxID=2800988 RepID=A0ABS1HNF4_9BACT|nr:hypothetical protein [Carboxylicivirga marina]MBK3519125.1 hypothetical protein [Carboxylicivirga marina]
MRSILVLIFGLILIGALSCDYKYIEPIIVEIPDTGEPVSFTNDVEPIFQPKCTSCHASRSPILTTGNAYNSLMGGGYVDTENPEESIIYVKGASGHPGGSKALTAEELAWILKWIEEGAANN